MAIKRNEDEIRAIYAEIDAQTDRGAAIIAVAIIDDFLIEALKRRLILTPRIEERIFNLNTGGLASEYAAKIELAYCVGIIGDDMADDLRLIGKIRNRFAHHLDPIDFEDQIIAEWCQTLHFKMAGENSRGRFLLAFTRISNVLFAVKNTVGMTIPHILKQPELASSLAGVSFAAK